MAEPRDAGSDGTITLHASAVAIGGRALLIEGRSGSGKSAIALALLARGATLVADDRTLLWRVGDEVLADAPDAIRGLIEARGLGILGAPSAGPTPVAAVLDLETTEAGRLPPLRTTERLEKSLPLLHKVESSHFVDALVLYLKEGRRF